MDEVIADSQYLFHIVANTVCIYVYIPQMCECLMWYKAKLEKCGPWPHKTYVLALITSQFVIISFIYCLLL